MLAIQIQPNKFLVSYTNNCCRSSTTNIKIIYSVTNINASQYNYLLNSVLFSIG